MLKPNLKYTFEITHEPVKWDNAKLTTLVIFGITVFMWIFSKPLNAFLGGFSKFDSLVAMTAIVMLGHFSGLLNGKI